MIRYATIDDMKIAFELTKLLGSDTFTFEEFEKCFIHNLFNNHILLYEENRSVLGLGVLHIFYPLHHSRKIAEIMELVIAGDVRGKGIGKKLLDEMTIIAIQNKCVSIEVASNRKRVDAHRFYKREGFLVSHFKFTKRIN
ncbi:GNAT family N-acetyltransferase [Acetivibrio cellulolyticus]|uniref:GNAT family N-acetyltransferase n=1 Tax=Acetivibrio cellulolyticus TaxID=35830 RepID=UPI0001E2CBB9|nr:GNAT family N-acetyltransferase [Acetivibrio cellulolyticus]